MFYSTPQVDYFVDVCDRQPKEKVLTASKRHRILSHFPNVAYNIVAIAASAGGIKAAAMLLSALPADFPAAVVLVQHLSPRYPSQLAHILNKYTPLQVKQAESGELLRQGTVYVAVPDRHLIVNPEGTLSLSKAAKVNFARPSATKLFSSVANSYRSRAIAVVLSGSSCDGALGVLSIKKYGGIAIAQDETTSEFFYMPNAAIQTKQVDLVLPLTAIAPALVDMVMTKVA